MSRIIQQIATVQFQVDNRKVTASMNALQTEAESLNGKIAAVNQSIKDLGDVPADNKFLLEYQKQLRQLNSDLKDVTTAQRDLMKGVKAADQLWKAAATQDIESLSIKAIKAGQNGLRKRMENLRPELGGDDAKMYDAYKAVIDEADRVMNVFKSNYATVVQTIRDGGIVSEQAMKSTRDALRDLMEAEKEGTAEHRQLAQQYDFLNESLTNVAEMRRREKGEIVNANDARREALKLTEDGIAAARRERDMADAVIAGMQQQKSDLDQLRRFHEDRIAQTEREIAANQRLEEAEQDRLADVEKAMRYNENEDRKEAIRLRKKADAARDEAEAKKESYEQQAEQEKLLRQRVKDTGDEVTNLTAKIEELGKTEAKPKVDTSEIERLTAELKEAERVLGNMEVLNKRDRNTIDTFTQKLEVLRPEHEKLDTLLRRKQEMDEAAIPFSTDNAKKSKPARFDRFDNEQLRYAIESLSTRYNNLKGEEYFESLSPEKQIERVLDSAFHNIRPKLDYPEEYLKFFRDLGEALEYSGIKAKFLFEETEKGMKFKGVDFLEGYVSRRSEYAQLKKSFSEYGDEGMAKILRTKKEAEIRKAEIEIESAQGSLKAGEKLVEEQKTLVDSIKKKIKTEQQSTTATNDQTEAIKKQEEELGKLEQKLKRLNESRDGYQNDVKESLKAVKDMGLTEEDLADDAKVREAVEKKVLEIMEAQAKVGQEIAEQRKKLAGEVKMSDLGGTKADQEFYAKNKDRWDVSDYASPDDMIERIAHLERLKKIKNGKRFNPDEDWDDDDDLDEDAPIMSDKEKQTINDELRFLKQHIREELLKTIHEVGDINKAVEQYTGGDGVSEDAKFGEQLNDKIGEIKDKIEERIETTIDRYGEMLTEDRDEDAKLTKEQLTSHVSQHMEAVKENHGFNRQWLEETQGDIETTKSQIESKKQLIEQMKQQAQVTKESTTADQQSVDVAKQKKELEGQLADATANHTKAQKDYEAQQEKTNKAQEKAYKAQEESVALNEKAATAEEKVAHQEERHAEAMGQQSERLRQIRAEGQRLLTLYEQQKTEIQAVDKAWADADVKQGEAEARKAQNQELTIKSLDDSIRKLKEANAVIDTNSDEWEENTRIIQRLQAALDEMKNKPALMMMTDRMQDVSKLSTAAVTETRKFWEAMVAGAERGSKELAEYEGHLKTITEEEQKREAVVLKERAGRLQNMDNYSVSEIREGIDAAKKMQDTFKLTDEEVKQLSEDIVAAETRISKVSVEAERQAQRQREAVELMESQLRNGANLTESALKAQVQYWQRLADDPKTAAEAVKQYTANMEQARALLDKSRESDIREKAGRLQNMDSYSVSEIREGIDAAKKMQDTFKLTDEEVKQLSEDIVAAETRISKISVETERAARKEAQAIADMREQLNLGTSLTESALKAQENYWRRLADQPGQAADKVREYTANMKEAQELQKDVAATRINDEGRNAFDFFKDEQQLENASAETIKKHADALKKWRDSLPQKGEAATIITINELLAKAGVLTKKAADDAMTYEQALHVLDVVTGKLKVTVESVESQVDRATSATRTAIGGLDNEIDGVNAEMAELNQRMNTLGDKSTDLTPYVKSLNEANKLLHEQREERQEYADMYKKEADERTRNIVKLKEEIALIKQQREDTVSSLNARIQAAQNTLNQLNSLSPEERGTSVISEMIQTQIRTIKELQKQRFDIASKAEQRLTQMHEQLTAAYKANEKATAEATLIIEQFDKKIDETQRSMKELSASIPGFDSGELGKYTAELTRLNDELRTQQQERERLVGTFDTARQKRAEGIEAMKQEIALIEKERDESIKAIDQQIQAQQEALATLQSLDPQTETFRQMAASIEQEIQRLQAQKTAVEQSAETKQKLADANERLKKAMEANAQATANEEAVIKGYDDKIKQLEKDIADYTQKLTAAKGSLDAKEYEHAEKQMGELQKRLASLTEQRKLYIEQLEREREEATRTAEAENARKLAGQENVSIDSIEKAIKVLEKFNKENNEPGGAKWEETEVYIGKLLKRLNELKAKSAELRGDFKEGIMSVETAKKIADEAGTRGFMRTAQEIQLATKALNEHRESLIKTIKQKHEDGNATDKEEAELADLTKKLRDLKYEQDNFNMSQEKMEMLMKKPTNAVNLDELRAAIKRADAELRRMEGSLGTNSKEYQKFAAEVKAAKNVLKEMEGQAKATTSAFDKAWSRLKTYVGLYVGASVAMNKLVGTMGDLMDLSDKMGEVRKTTGFTADEVGRLSGELKKFDTRTTLNGLLDLSVAAGQLGLKTEEDVLGFTEAANKLMVALPEMGREGATEMLKVALATGEIDKIRKQMEQGLIDGSSATAVAMEKVGSTIDRLRATSAATAPAITDFVKRVGAVGAQSGISIDQVAALGSTVDALGMRVEMSATALSRMIPAIKNNAFDVAKAIGVTPEYLRGLFNEAGGGMKAMLMIFQHIKDSGMSEDNIEKMLGMGNLKEIMKELNQQGARAGIVFSGLSQNVDTLREHLGTASDAYRENVAIQQEYEKMNETTMAKWERLKNEIEEMFVGDGAQRFLGGIIDGIREIVDLLTGPLKGAAAGLGAGLSAYKLGLGSLLEKMWDFARGEEDVTEKWEEWTEKLKDKDVWGIVTSGVIAAGVAIYTYVDGLQEAAREAAKFARDVVDEQNKVENLTKAIGDAKTKVEEADKEVEKARKAVDEAKKSLDGTKESTDRLTEANSKLLVSEEKKRNEMATQKKLIETFNNEYGKYLGFMLSEVSSNYELIKARDLANTKLRETIALKRKEAALGRIEESEGEGRDEAYAALSQAVSGSIRKQVVTGHDKNGNEIKTWTNDQEATTRLLRDLTKMAQAQNMTAGEVEKALADAGLNIYEKRNGKQQINTYGANLRNLVMNYRNEYQAVQSKIKDVETQFDVEASIDREEAQGKLKEQFRASEKNYADLETSYAKAQGDARKQAAANLLKQADTLEEMISAAPNYYDLSNDTEKAAYEKFVTDTQKRIDGIKGQRESLLKEAGALYKSRKTVQGETTTSLTPTSPWGGNAPADSTDYGTWDVNELVARRNQMDKFKNVLKPDTDIRAVLAEDKALMKALDNGLKEDWKSVIGWYNTERKKIQEELKSERFSTNEGHWRDEKQGRGRKNRFRESDYALAELDRYYSKRKEELEKARIEENMSEELFNRQAELLEQEHLERRSKLRETFTAGSTEQEKKMVKQFREWWDQLEKQGLLDEVPWATVESEWSKALASEIGRNNLRAQQDLTKLQEITVKHLNEMAKLIDKERPYDGITANLRKNLTEMDILLADMQKDGPEKDTAKLVKAETIRLKFLLSEAEQAYSMNFEQMKEKMVKEGFGEWAQAIEGDEQLKQSLMQNLRNTYDAIQEAIKKESSVIKKQLEIQWNDLMPGSDMSMKGMFEKAVSDLGLAGDQVKRANSLIGAGTASDRVADKLAIQQMKIQLQMQETYFALMQKIGRERIKQLEQSAVANEREAKALKEKAELLRKEGKTAEAEVTELKAQNALRQSLQDKFDAEHAAKSLSLARTKELAEEEKQRVAIANQLEESQNRLYQELKSWADLLTSSLQGVFEASHTADREYYNERAKLDLTGKGGPGAGTYIVIDNEGTSDAKAHYEYLDERQALERQREIENDNAVAEALRKMWDDLNTKMSEQIKDWMNATLQRQAMENNTAELQKTVGALDANAGQVSMNTGAVISNTGALNTLTKKLAEGIDLNVSDGNGGGKKVEATDAGKPTAESDNPSVVFKSPEAASEDYLWEQGYQQVQFQNKVASGDIPAPFASADAAQGDYLWSMGLDPATRAQVEMDANDAVTQNLLENKELQLEANEKVAFALQKQFYAQTSNDKKQAQSAQIMFAKMVDAANMYGVAYQAISNENLSATQKFQSIALQTIGSMTIAGLEALKAEMIADAAAKSPGVLGTLWKQLGWAAAPVFAIFTGLLGGLMGLATSKISSSKSQIASATGASVGAGRLSTGMLTYAEGNVNEFTDPDSLTPGRSYNVDGADGKTYRAKYTGRNPRTHITNGPEFHLAGEAGKEMIIDAGTTRQITMNEAEIWHAIKTLSGGGRLSHSQSRRSGMRAFADGNVEDFDEMGGDGIAAYGTGGGMSMEQMMAFQQSLDRNNELLERALTEGIKAVNKWDGPDGIPNMYNKMQKEAKRHGVKYL